MSSLTGLSPNNPRDYVGPNVALNTVVTRNREPTGADYRQPETGKLYPFNTYWLVGKNPTTGVQGDLWYLSKIAGNVGFWLQLSSGGAGPLLNIDVQSATAPGVDPVTPTGAGTLIVNGAAVANHGVPLETHTRALNEFNLEVQYATSAAATNATLSGIAHFNSSQFSVDANGFVSLSGGGLAIDSVQVDGFTAPGTNPVSADANGLMTVTGAQVATGTTVNGVRTFSLAANAYQIQIQRTTSAASSTIGLNGIAHFNSGQFTVDANGFVSLTGGGLAIDSFTTDIAGPVGPDGNGNVAFTAATNIFSDGTIANTMRLNLQGTNHALFVGRGNQVASASLSTGNSGQILQSLGAGSDPVWVDSPILPINPNNTLFLVDDFMGMVSGTATNAALAWVSTPPIGFYNGTSLAVEADHPGIIGHTAFATAGSSPILVMGSNGGAASTTIMAIGGGAILCRWIFKINTLSTVTNTYTLNLGLADAFGAAAADQANGLYFVYSNAINSGKWQVKSALAAARTTVNSAVAVTTGWHKADVVVNAAGTSAEFFMDGVSLGTVAATMPTNTTNISPFVSALRSAGTVPANALAIDLFYLNQVLTSTR